MEFLLPAPLRAYAAGEAAQPASPVVTGLWVGVIAATVVSWIGLLNLLRAARPLYLARWVGYLVLALLGGPVVQASLEYAAQMLLARVGGIIVGTASLPQLYDLASDPGETKNVAQAQPDRVRQMQARLRRIQTN